MKHGLSQTNLCEEKLFEILVLADTHIAPNLMKIIQIRFCKNVAQTNGVKLGGGGLENLPLCPMMPKVPFCQGNFGNFVKAPPRGETN